jgi:hypothetical protein
MKWVTEPRGNERVYPRDDSSRRSLNASSLPVWVRPWRAQTTGKVFLIFLRLGLRAAPGIRDTRGLVAGFSVCVDPARH